MSQSNHLIHESSPYLLQHAHNPVDWYPWGAEALKKASDEKKPILLSIGYSSCHWCHVMAHESFENEEIAALMNERFVNIKLDREERPDIDNIYMDAVQAMGLHGGWPLNVFITSDQKPFYGGTYFPPEQWKKLLVAVSDAYQNNYDHIYESASRFAESISQSESEKYGLTYAATELSLKDFDAAYEQIEKRFDPEWGGMKKSPKFPMPCLWNFLLTYSSLAANTSAQEHVLLTLDKMASGGIYDHLGGGFSRYSVDNLWHVPHFEKMLYDNGQLLSLYANAYKLSKKEEYKSILEGTAQWLKREMQDQDGGFYSALDADSEGEEGKYYVWTFREVQEIAQGDFSIIAEYYNVTNEGNWEEGKNVLRKLETDEKLAEELQLSPEKLAEIIGRFKENGLKERAKRPRPGLDNKKISGWNGLALSGLCESYQATKLNLFKELAQSNAKFLKSKMMQKGRLLRVSNQDTEGFLEDYAAVIQSFLDHYETFFDEEYLELALAMTRRVLANFYDADQKLFYYTSTQSESLIARKKELFDNVIPSSNSIMAKNLYRLGLMYDNDEFKKLATEMSFQVNKLIKQETEYLSNWAIVSLMISQSTPEIVIIGKDALPMSLEIQEHYLPNKILMSSVKKNTLPLFEYKSDIDDKTTIFVCYDKVCKRPVFEITKALHEVHNKKE